MDTCNVTSWDNFIALYHDNANANNPSPFNPSSPLTNCLIASDGLDSSGVTIDTIHLLPGTYTLVTNGAQSFTAGTYTATVTPIAVPATNVVAYTGGLTILSATGPVISALPNTNSLSAPTSLSTSGTSLNVPYQSIPFTISTAGTYSIEVDSIMPQNLWTNELLLYKNSFSPTAPLTNCQFAVASTVNGTGTYNGLADNSTDKFLARASGVTLAAGNYILVVTGTNVSSFGPYTANILSGNLPYPPIIPDNTPAGLSAVLTVPAANTTAVGSLDSVVITGLSHPRAGDLVVTLSHNGTTIELFDRIDHFTTSDSGSVAKFVGDYTFAGTGSDLGAAAGGLSGSLIDPTLTYAQYLNGITGVESSTFTGDFTAFNGMPITGTWTVKLADYKSGPSFTNTLAQYSGFKFTVSTSVSGKLTFDSLVATAPAQTVTFTFRSSGNADIVKTLSIGQDGNYTVTGLPYGVYTMHIKGSSYLAVNLPVDTTNGSATGANATLLGGDADNNNTVDIGDFGVLVNAYGGVSIMAPFVKTRKKYFLS